MKQLINIPVFCLLLCGTELFAGYHTTESDVTPSIEALAICPNAEALVTEAYEEWSESTRLLAEAKSDIEAQKKIGRIAKKLGQSYVRSQALTRKIMILSQMGEPASVDLGHRAKQLTDDLIQLRDRRDSTVYRHLTGPAKAKYDAERPRIIQRLQKISRLYNNSKFREAEELLNQLYDEVNTYGFFLAPKWRQSLYTQIAGVGGPIQRKMNEFRMSEFRTTLNDKFESEFPTLDKLRESFESSIRQIGNRGTATLEGKTLSGPELLSFIINEFLTTNVKLVRCKALAASLNDRNLTAKTHSAMVELKANLTKYATELIQADAQRVAADEAPNLYLEYMQTLMPIANSVDSYDIVFVCEKPLMDIVAKSPSFAEEVQAYKDGTADLLYWRRKLANAQRENLLEHYPKVNKFLFNQLSTMDESRNVGLDIIEFSQDKVPTVLGSPLNAIQQAADDRLVGNYVLLDEVVNSENSLLSGVKHRYWVTIDKDIDLSQPIDALKADLFATEENTPLSIEAAFSLATAELNNYEEVGGKITKSELESVIHRFAQMPLDAGVLTPVGRELHRVSINQIMAKLKFEADWIKHKHFFIDLYQPDPSDE